MKTNYVGRNVLLLLSFCTLSLSFVPTLLGQGTWTQKANVSNTLREQCFSAALDGKGYMGGGISFTPVSVILSDFWTYDPNTNIWTQKANYPGAGPRGCFSFALNGKLYVGAGKYQEGSAFRDFWEYNPITNVWIQKGDFPGAPRYGAFGFSIGSKGYAGGGVSNNFYKDFYEYEPTTDTWTQKSDFGGGGTYWGSSFVLASKGYVGTGYSETGYSNKLYEYNPATNVWTQKASLGGPPRVISSGFALNGKGYIGLGTKELYPSTLHPYLADFWEYDLETDHWTRMTDYAGGERESCIGFAIGNKGYIGAGEAYVQIGMGRSTNDFYEFTPPSPCTNYALNFDGVNDLVQFENLFPLHQTGDCTLEFWIKPRTTNSNPSIFWTRIGDDDLNRFNIFQSIYVSYDYRDPSGNLGGHVFNRTTLNGANTWSHQAVVRQGNTYSVYMNGQFVASSNDFNPNLPTSIGWALSGRNIFPYDGLMDEIRIWNVARTPAEMQTHFNLKLQGNEPNLIGYWDFDTGTGDFLRDKTAWGNHGKLGNLDIAKKPTWVADGAPLNHSVTTSIQNLAATYCSNSAAIPLIGLPAGGTFKVDGNEVTSFDPASLSIGNHTVTYFVGCYANTATQTVNITAAPVFTVNYPPILCFGQKTTITITPTNGGMNEFVYAVAPEVSLVANPIFPNQSAGNYEIRVSNRATGCSANQNWTITQPTRLQAVITKYNITCKDLNDGQITVNASEGTPPYQYNLNGLGYQPNAVFSNLSAGTYNIAIKDANNCIVNKNNILITNPATLNLVVATTNILCHGAATGKITAAAAGGTGQKQYSKNNGVTWQVGATFSGLTAGSYEIVAKDVNECRSLMQTVVLTEPNLLEFTTHPNHLSCRNAGDGSILITATGGTPPMMYSIHGQYFNNNSFANLAAGNYAVRVRDANGCVTPLQTVQLTQPTWVNFTTSVVNVVCNGEGNGKITINNPTGGNGVPYEFSINNGSTWQTTPVFSPLSAGIYNVKIKDVNGCFSAVKIATVSQPNPITFGITKQEVSCGYTSNGVIAVTQLGGGTAPYRFSKNGGLNFQVSPVFLGLPVETYPIQVKDNKNCLSSIQSVSILDACASSAAYFRGEPTPQIQTVLLNIAPNPTFNVIEIELNSLKEREQTFLFFDVLGKVQHSETRSLTKGIQRLVFDCTELPQGVYEILAIGSEGRNQPRRFVKL